MHGLKNTAYQDRLKSEDTRTLLSWTSTFTGWVLNLDHKWKEDALSLSFVSSNLNVPHPSLQRSVVGRTSRLRAPRSPVSYVVDDFAGESTVEEAVLLRWRSNAQSVGLLAFRRNTEWESRSMPGKQVVDDWKQLRIITTRCIPCRRPTDRQPPRSCYWKTVLLIGCIINNSCNGSCGQNCKTDGFMILLTYSNWCVVDSWQ